jgi:hypothetical protein
VYPKDVQIPPGEEWYYEFDGRPHGPLSRTDLDELLNHSGETASDVRVRQGADGAWRAFRARSPAAPASTSETRQSSGASTLVPQESMPPSSVAPRGSLLRHWDIGAAVGVWILLNAFFFCWPDPYSHERQYLQTLRGIQAEAQELRAKLATDGEWRQFAERTNASLTPIVNDLKKSASSSEPVRQQLLWSARDLLPRMLGPQTKEREEHERRLKQYLDSAQRELNKP